MSGLQTLAFISKAEKHVVVILPFDERIVYEIVFLPIGGNAIQRAEFQYPIQYGFVNTNLYIGLQCFQNRLKIQNRLRQYP